VVVDAVWSLPLILLDDSPFHDIHTPCPTYPYTYIYYLSVCIDTSLYLHISIHTTI